MATLHSSGMERFSMSVLKKIEIGNWHRRSCMVVKNGTKSVRAGSWVCFEFFEYAVYCLWGCVYVWYVSVVGETRGRGRSGSVIMGEDRLKVAVQEVGSVTIVCHQGTVYRFQRSDARMVAKLFVDKFVNTFLFFQHCSLCIILLDSTSFPYCSPPFRLNTIQYNCLLYRAQSTGTLYSRAQRVSRFYYNSPLSCLGIR